MITEAALKRQARAWGVQDSVADLDYTLGWFLHALITGTDLARHLVFKGGTCLRKCYFPDYRFSEDLDFTVTARLTVASVRAAVNDTQDLLEQHGFEFPREARVDVIEDDYGRESMQVRIYFRAALQQRSDPRAIRLDLSRDETIAFEPVSRSLLHAYPDADDLAGTRLRCYDLREVAAEKLRAVCGQRRHAIARDVYDLANLVAEGLDIEVVLPAVPEKFARKGVPLDSGVLERFEARRGAFAIDWSRTVEHLVRPDAARSFDSAWSDVLPWVARVASLA